MTYEIENNFLILLSHRIPREGSYRQVFSVENIRGYELEKVAIKEYVYE